MQWPQLDRSRGFHALALKSYGWGPKAEWDSWVLLNEGSASIQTKIGGVPGAGFSHWARCREAHGEGSGSGSEEEAESAGGDEEDDAKVDEEAHAAAALQRRLGDHRAGAAEATFGGALAVGDALVACDSKGFWADAKVLAVREPDGDAPRALRVHFRGWKAKYDEWIPLGAGRLRAQADDGGGGSGSKEDAEGASIDEEDDAGDGEDRASLGPATLQRLRNLFEEWIAMDSDCRRKLQRDQGSTLGSTVSASASGECLRQRGRQKKREGSLKGRRPAKRGGKLGGVTSRPRQQHAPAGAVMLRRTRQDRCVNGCICR